MMYVVFGYFSGDFFIRILIDENISGQEEHEEALSVLVELFVGHHLRAGLP